MEKMQIKRNVLLNPGPATTTDTVKMAQVVPDICPREKEFAGLMKGLRSDLLKVVHAPEDQYTSVLFCGSGTINIDVCINSLVPEGKKVLVVNNGAYNSRAVEVCQMYHIPHIDLKSSVYEQPDLKAVEQALKATRGQILCYEDEICDARFSKCCGGVTEEYQYCWEDTPKPYLISVEDPFCNTDDKAILAQVLNDYDQETNDFYRWKVEYTVDEISALINEKLKDDFGTITDLIPLERGKSGRIWKLKIVGTKKTFTIGKELEIRRALSESHLYSSAFDVEKTPNGFRLIGKGWGHGVGLCQIGAAVMGQQGYTYEQILLHYYRNAEIKKIY